MESGYLSSWIIRGLGGSYKRITLLYMFFILPGLFSQAFCQVREVTLKNGSIIRAESIQRTEERIVLDLGYSVLTIPLDQVTSEGLPLAAMSDGIILPQEGDALLTSKTLTGLSLGVNKNAPRKKETFGEMIDRLEQAVVIVSNPGGLGAGFLIDPKGLLLTNYHVVRGEKFQNVTVFMKKDGKTEQIIYRNVEVLAFSPLLDCALLRISPKDIKGMELPYMALADPSSIQTGMLVYAIGNPGLGSQILDHSVSQGILSSTGRNFNDILYLQTTAAVNPGNSGGPLLNSDGDVVGLVTFRAIFQEGLGFALPAWYLRLFVANAKSFAPNGDDKNTGYRYHSPMAQLAKEKETAE